MNGKQALVLGATGGIGGEVARRLVADGWRVRAMHRDPARIEADPAFEWRAGDAMRAEDVAAAAEGVSLIVHAVNPPGYRDWDKLVLPMIDHTIAAARVNRARVLLPGTVYNYGPDAFPLIDEAAPQHPETRKGAIRAEMEARLRAATERGEIRALVVRAGDYFGPQAGSSWFSQGLVQPGRRPRWIVRPGRAGIGHQWAYLPDVAEAMVRLAGRGDLDDFAMYHFGGFFDADGTGMIAAIQRALAPSPMVVPMPWWLLRLASPFVTLAREMGEMRYLWQRPVQLDNRRLVAKLGAEPQTPLDVAVRATLRGLGCLEDAAIA